MGLPPSSGSVRAQPVAPSMVPTAGRTYQHRTVPATPTRVQVRGWAPPVTEMPSTREMLAKSLPDVMAWNSRSHSVQG